jgi:transposase
MESLAGRLAADAELPAVRRRSGQKLFEELQSEGYEGGYDSVRRYVKFWKETNRRCQSPAFVPLDFAKGEAFQFDWSEETVEIGGVCQKLQVAQVRLCYSRMRFCVAFTRQELPMLIAAHIKAHDFFSGLCLRGIYDNSKAVVDKIGRGKERVFNARFLQLASHYLFEPEACIPPWK